MGARVYDSFTKNPNLKKKKTFFRGEGSRARDFPQRNQTIFLGGGGRGWG